MSQDLLEIILGSSIVTTAATTVISYFFHKKTERANAEIKREFEILSRTQDADFEWKKQTAEVLGQIYLCLNRTRMAMKNAYSKQKSYNSYFEDEIMFATNKRVRDLILENGHHIPPELLEEASLLVEHYDMWLMKYHQLRIVQKDITTVKIYVGPDNFPFPDKAEEKFKESYIRLFNEIMGRSKGFDLIKTEV